MLGDEVVTPVYHVRRRAYVASNVSGNTFRAANSPANAQKLNPLTPSRVYTWSQKRFQSGMDARSPWTENWQIVQDLSLGGQGVTLLVTARDPNRGTGHCVLKILKDQSSPEARARMFREVAHLRTLHDARCRVPRLIQSNVQDYPLAEVPLYLVMEYIPGATLAAHVEARGGLDLAESAAIALQLCENVGISLHQDILHRDLKPENIIVRAASGAELNHAVEVVVLDFGLSFNRREPDPLTRANETLDNSFLSLPERRVPGGNRRDPRSDLTGICGLLYFCLTAHQPVDLVGPDNRAPHRRSGFSIKEKLGEGSETRRLEAFFDRGFSANIEMRYQTADELTAQLRHVLHPAIHVPFESPATVAERLSNSLRKQDRPTQLAFFRKRSESLRPSLYRHNRTFDEKLREFVFIDPPQGEERWQLSGSDDLGVRYDLALKQSHHIAYIVIAYQVRATGTQCTVFRATFRGLPGVPALAEHKPWQAIFHFDGNQPEPDFADVLCDLDAMLNEAMEELDRLIASGAAG